MQCRSRHSHRNSPSTAYPSRVSNSYALIALVTAPFDEAVAAFEPVAARTLTELDELMHETLSRQRVDELKEGLREVVELA
jgi:hypothetical protein